MNGLPLGPAISTQYSCAPSISRIPLIEQSIAVMLEKYEVCCGLFHGFDWSKWTGDRSRLRVALEAVQYLDELTRDLLP
jgi:Domain of unknown function (DUF3387)